MNSGIIKEIKKYILKGLESKIEQILTDKSKNIFLTKRDLLLLSRYMGRRRILSYNLIRYIFKRSIYSHSYDPQDEIIILFKRIIIIACEKGDLKVVRLLLSDDVVQKYNSFYISIKINGGYSKACIGGNLDMVKFILRYSREQEISTKYIDPREYSNHPLVSACQLGHIEIVKFLLDDVMKLYPNINTTCINNADVIFVACKYNQIEILKFLLSQEMKELYPKTEPCEPNNYAIMTACRSGNFEIVKLLLSDEVLILYPNINPSAMSNSSIVYASQNSNYKIIKFLLSEDIISRFPNISPSADENCVLRNACEDEEIEIVKYLLSNDMVNRYPSINSKVKDKKYCLRIAKKNGHAEMVNFLLERNPNLIAAN
jgi:ankyrin repeat protein